MVGIGIIQFPTCFQEASLLQHVIAEYSSFHRIKTGLGSDGKLKFPSHKHETYAFCSWTVRYIHKRFEHPTRDKASDTRPYPECRIPKLKRANEERIFFSFPKHRNTNHLLLYIGYEFMD